MAIEGTKIGVTLILLLVACNVSISMANTIQNVSHSQSHLRPAERKVIADLIEKILLKSQNSTDLNQLMQDSMEMYINSDLKPYPELKKGTKSFHKLFHFRHELIGRKSPVPKNSPLYKCFEATYAECFKELKVTPYISSLIGRYECAYNFYIQCKLESYVHDKRYKVPDVNN